MCIIFVFKQKTAYEMRISDWSSDVCSSDLVAVGGGLIYAAQADPATLAVAGSAGAGAALAAVPATGWPFFIAIGFAYFVLAFLLLGAVFLGVGSQAATVREIQMLSLPITIFQVAMLSLCSAAASMPGSVLATLDRKSTRLNSSPYCAHRMPTSAL